MALTIPVDEPTIEPSAVSPANIGTNGRTPPETIGGSFIIRGDFNRFPFFSFFIEATATFIADCIVSGFDFLIAVLAPLTNRLNVIIFGQHFFDMRPPTFDRARLAPIAAETAIAVARSPSDASLDITRLLASCSKILSASDLDLVSLYLEYAISCCLQAASNGLIPGSPRAKRFFKFVPIDCKFPLCYNVYTFIIEKIYNHLDHNIDMMERVIRLAVCR